MAAYTDIDNPKDYFSVNTWTADDSTPRSFTGFGHQPDLLWVKHRGSASIRPTIIDSVRGGDKMLATPTTAAEDTKSHGEVTAFGSDGITVADGTNGTYPKLYFNDLNVNLTLALFGDTLFMSYAFSLISLSVAPELLTLCSSTISTEI